MKEIRYTVPSTQTSNVTRTVVKPLSECSPDEVLLAYQQNVPQDWEPTAEQKIQDELYSMPIEDLLAKANEQFRAKAEQELDVRQAIAATTWAAYEPRYKKTDSNARQMYAALKERKLAGTVGDFQDIFADLSARGQLELNHIPIAPRKVWSREELYALPLDEAKAAIEQMGRDGIL